MRCKVSSPPLRIRTNFHLIIIKFPMMGNPSQPVPKPPVLRPFFPSHPLSLKSTYQQRTNKQKTSCCNNEFEHLSGGALPCECLFTSQSRYHLERQRSRPRRQWVCVVLWSLHSEKVSQKVDVGLKGRGPGPEAVVAVGRGLGWKGVGGGGGALFNNPRLILRLRLRGGASVSWPAKNICFHLNK